MSKWKPVGDGRRWFAWYPVRFYDTGRWVWLRWVHYYPLKVRAEQ
jgi:hypothetical protein